MAFGISYYGQCENLAALLNLSIRNDTDGGRGLDDVMRPLFSEFYQRGRGFTTEAMIGVINRLTRKDYHDFLRRYVFGTEAPNYDQIFGYAGYQLQKKDRPEVELGFSGRFRGNGFSVQMVEPNSIAWISGLRPGDTIAKLDGQLPSDYPIDSAAGKTVKLTVVLDDNESSFR